MLEPNKRVLSKCISPKLKIINVLNLNIGQFLLLYCLNEGNSVWFAWFGVISLIEVRFWSHCGILFLVRAKLDRHHPTQFYYLHAFSSTPIYLCVKLWFIKICFSQANEIAGMHFGAAESWFNMAFRRISWETGNKVVTNTIITLEVNLPTIVSPPLFPPRPLILGFGDRSDSVGDSKIMIRLSPNQINAF